MKEDEMSKKPLFLVCNAHLDPVWLWEWEEGAGEALSTFRTAARFCEEFEEFIFCHNEAVLYQWVEALDPELFSLIQDLVKQGRWHIMGGWYLQPDCNMPSGEGFVRQILAGKRYFREKFGVNPTTAVNFDPFGHSRGLVQILKKAGYDSYLFCRPDPKSYPLPDNDFLWQGYDGSSVMAHRAPDHYNSRKGFAGEKITAWMAENETRTEGLLLWGIGNHGGGPSREDLKEIRKLAAQSSEWDVRHGIPEEYFSRIRGRKDLPVFKNDLNPWAVGCYSTMALIKQAHRCLENLYFMTEKMAAHASREALMAYPRLQMQEALEDLLYTQFHDILPGSSISEVEAHALRRMCHGMEICERIRLRAFASLTSGQREAKEEEIPIFVYNPHPFETKAEVVVEFQPAEPLYDKSLQRIPEIRDEAGKLLPCQLEKESSSIADDWRKRIAFRASLGPGRMNRFFCSMEEVPRKPEKVRSLDRDFMFKTDRVEIRIDPAAGLLAHYSVDGLPFLNGAVALSVMEDYPDPWGMLVNSFDKIRGSFSLMNPEESAAFAGVDAPRLPPVRIIERGPVRTIVEALLQWNHSAACVRYVLPAEGAEIGLELRVFWNEKDAMLKLAVPTPFADGSCLGQVAYGIEDFGRRQGELIAQAWTAVLSKDRSRALTVINDCTYGFDFTGGEIRPSLLRSSAYAAHPTGEGIPIVPQDRFTPRIDQGERTFRFWIQGGPAEKRMAAVSREAQAKNETPMALCYFPGGGGESPRPLYEVEGEALAAAVKPEEEGDGLVLRLFQPSGKGGDSLVKWGRPAVDIPVSLGPFEIKTILVDSKGKATETDLLERGKDR